MKDEAERVALTVAELGYIPPELGDVSHQRFHGGGGRVWYEPRLMISAESGRFGGTSGSVAMDSNIGTLG
jgi:hypothetical protein